MKDLNPKPRFDAVFEQGIKNMEDMPAKDVERVAKILQEWTNEPNWVSADIPTIATEIVQSLSATPPANTQTYSLNCDKCGKVFESKLAFPEPQLCLACFTPAKEVDWEKLMLTEEEIEDATHVAEDSGVPINDSAFYGISLAYLKALCKAQLLKVRQAMEGK